MKGVECSTDNGTRVAVYQVKDLDPVQLHHRMTLNGSTKQKNLGHAIRYDKVRSLHKLSERKVFSCFTSFPFVTSSEMFLLRISTRKT